MIVPKSNSAGCNLAIVILYFSQEIKYNSHCLDESNPNVLMKRWQKYIAVSHQLSLDFDTIIPGGNHNTVCL